MGLIRVGMRLKKKSADKICWLVSDIYPQHDSLFVEIFSTTGELGVVTYEEARSWEVINPNFDITKLN